MTLRLASLLAALLACHVARAAAAELIGYYDLDALGIPKFVNVNYIDVSKISQISKFRSSAGHDYHDDAESCRSMKHYFIAPDATTAIVSPIAGTVTRLNNDFDGKQVQITSDLQPGFIFILFHVNLAKPLAVGDHIAEGQPLGTHVGTQTFSDIAVAVNTPKDYRLISYFETLTDNAFAVFQARGIASRSQMSFTKAERDAAPYRCQGEDFAGLKVDPKTEYVNLSGVQSITYPYLPYTLALADSGYPLAATASSGLPVKISSAGACNVVNDKLIVSEAGECVVYFNQPGDARYLPAIQLEYRITVLPALADVAIGSVFSGAQPAAQSFLRLFNAGEGPGTVKVKLTDSATGRAVATWTSPAIPAGASAQFAVAAMDAGVASSIARPPLYTAAIETTMQGTVQHVLWNSSAGALTNLSTCSTGATINRTQVNNVHSSLLQADYPSTVIVTNTAAAESPVQLGVFDATSGARLGTYVTATVPANGQLSIAVPTIEAGARITPAAGANHYNLKAEGSFTGYLQHVVNSKLAGLSADLTTVCPLRVIPQTTAATRIGSVYSTAQIDLQSFIRIYNIGGVRDGTVTLTLADAATGRVLGAWKSPGIFTGVAQQFSLATIEAGAGIVDPKPAAYVIAVKSEFGLQNGYLQHVVWRPRDGTLANLTTCDDGVTALPLRLLDIHSKVLATDYPSTIMVLNSGSLAKSFGLRLGNALSGIFYGRFVGPSVPAMGMVQVSPATLEATAPFILSTNTPHYVVEEDSQFPGFLQHLVTNRRPGVITDMTAMCRLN